MLSRKTRAKPKWTWWDIAKFVATVSCTVISTIIFPYLKGVYSEFVKFNVAIAKLEQKYDGQQAYISELRLKAGQREDKDKVQDERLLLLETMRPADRGRKLSSISTGIKFLLPSIIGKMIIGGP